MRRRLTGLLAASLAVTLLPGATLATDITKDPTELKIGVVTDVGTLDDKNFNEFSWLGAVAGAEALGAAAPEAIVTTASADYGKNIQTFIDQGFDIIVTIGFAIGADTLAAAQANPDVHFIGVDQFQCYGENCSGEGAPSNFQSIVFNEAQPGYLAGIVAAYVSKTGEIAAFGGSSTIPPVVSYMRGFENGAKSVNPDITVHLAYVSDDLGKAFNDPAGGTAFTEQFLQQFPNTDIVFQVAGKTGNGMIQAVCSARDAGADIWAIGVDVDQYLSVPDLAGCILTSAEKRLASAVEQSILAAATNGDTGGNAFFNASNEGIGLSPHYEATGVVPAEATAAVDAALAAFDAGTLDPCSPQACVP